MRIKITAPKKLPRWRVSLQWFVNLGLKNIKGIQVYCDHKVIDVLVLCKIVVC